MSIYLPIAEININIFLIVFIGMLVGALSGLFGVGGGFLMTPLLIFLGIPPVVAVGSEAPHVLASSVSGVIAHWRKKNVDFKMGFFLLSGGVIGSTLGVNLFKLLKTYGQIDIVIQFLFIIFLGFIGISMAFESAKTTIKNYIPNNKISKEIDSCSILLLLLNNTKIQNTTPYKLFDYLVSEKNILTLGDYPSGDVDHLLKKYKRSKRLNYSENESIRGYLIKMFELYKNKKLKNIKLDYSELRYNHLAKKLDRIFNS